MSLNTSASTGDDANLVEMNLSRVARFLNVPRSHLFFATQVHGAHVLRVDRTSDYRQVELAQADATLSFDPNVACAVRVADCAPVLIADRRSGAAVAVHSGWRGTVQRIVPAAVRLLRDIVSAEPSIVAAVGPHLESCCFEVGEDVADQIAACSGAERNEVVLEGLSDRPHADLRVVLHAQLRESGIDEESIDHVRGCSYCDLDSFYSYRRDGKVSGRLLAAICPSGPRTFSTAR